MQKTFERVTERHGGKTAPVKHFYRRQYQVAGGDWRTIYYAIFTDWKGNRRKMPLGSEVKAAKDAHLSRERELVAPIKRLFGPVLLNELKRERLLKYRTQRLQEHIIRGGKAAAKKVSAGTVANELSCLRHMINKARESEIGAATPSFAGLIQRSQRDRILDVKEEGTMLAAYPAWLRRLAVVARETCLS